jgi:hypothetical protein
MTARHPAVRLLLALGLAAVTVGCFEPSRVDPDAPVTITGAVRGPDGSPLAGRPVRLGGGLGPDEAAFAVLTLGLACTTGVCTGEVADTSTAADGTYRFDLTGRDTQSTFGGAVSQLLSVSAAPGPAHVSGPAASARFQVQVADVRLPVLDLVDPGLVVEGAGDVVARWSTPRPGPYELTFEEAAPAPVWRVTTGSGAATVDPRVLEDSSGRVVVSAGSTDHVEGSDVELRWRSPGVAYAAGAGPPPSRGQACRAVDDRGSPAPPAGACPVTDGDLTTTGPVPVPCPPPATGQPATCPRAVAVQVDVPPSLPAELVVVRGCEGGCAVEVSEDGSSYRPAGAASAGFGVVLLDGRPVAAVRVGLGSGAGLREVSVWAGRPGTAGLRAVDPASSGLRRAFSAGGGGGDGGGVPLGVGVVAAVLAGAVLVATGYVAGRRRDRGAG